MPVLKTTYTYYFSLLFKTEKNGIVKVFCLDELVTFGRWHRVCVRRIFSFIHLTNISGTFTVLSIGDLALNSTEKSQMSGCFHGHGTLKQLLLNIMKFNLI